MSETAPPATGAPRRGRRLARLLVERLLLVGFGLAAAVLCGELALRLLEDHPLWPPLLPEPYVDNELLYQVSATRLFELRPGADEEVGREQVRIRINAAGFRDDREYVAPKPPGVRRILVLGDSFSFAGKVPLEQGFARRLEARLNADPAAARYEVLNLAVPGYNSWQQRLLLEERGLAFQPDLVLVAFVLNDALPAVQLVPQKARLPLPVRRVLKRFALVQFLAASLKRLPVLLSGRRFKGGSEADALAEGTPGWSMVQQALLDMQRLAAGGGSELLLVIWPLFEGLEADYRFADRHEQLSRFCARHGIPVLDLLPTLRGTPSESLWVARGDHHPNAEAQSRAALAVHEGLRLAGWLVSPGK